MQAVSGGTGANGSCAAASAAQAAAGSGWVPPAVPSAAQVRVQVLVLPAPSSTVTVRDDGSDGAGVTAPPAVLDVLLTAGPPDCC